MYQELVKKYGGAVRTHSVEVKINDTNGKYFLPDDAILRCKPIVGLFTRFNPDDNQYAPDSGRQIVNEDGIADAYLTLVHNNKEILSGHPLQDLAISTFDRDHRQILIEELTPSKSYIVIGNTTTPANKIAVGESILLHFVYLDV
jgi:hypothetical protein